MTRENYERKVLYEMLGKITQKKPYAIRMFFFRHKWNVLDPKDFLAYVERQSTKRGD